MSETSQLQPDKTFKFTDEFYRGLDKSQITEVVLVMQYATLEQRVELIGLLLAMAHGAGAMTGINELADLIDKKIGRLAAQHKGTKHEH